MIPQEKIRQFVIMARHPEAVDYLEADEYEKEYEIPTFGQIISADETRTVIQTKHIEWLKRPITAMDVCWALNKLDTINTFSAVFKYRLDTKCRELYIMSSNPLDYPLDDIICRIQENKDGTPTILDDWSDEVCEKIAELI